MTTRLGEISEQQGETHNAITTQTTSLEALGRQQSQQLTPMVRQLVEDVGRVRYQMSNPPPRAALDPTKDLPILLEDPLGTRLTVPMEWVKSWEVGTLGREVAKFVA